jgi:hypothetical protein
MEEILSACKAGRPVAAHLTTLRACIEKSDKIVDPKLRKNAATILVAIGGAAIKCAETSFVGGMYPTLPR